MMERLERVDPGVTGSTIDKDKTVGSAVTHCFSVAVADVTMDHLKEVRWTGNRVFVTAFLMLATLPSSKGVSDGWMKEKLGWQVSRRVFLLLKDRKPK
jgi:hypothetical protein